MKKVLHIALNNLRQESLCDALSTLGEYWEIDWIHEQRSPGFRQKVIDMSKDADIVFMQLQTGDVISPAMAREMGGFRINWTGDVRQPLPDWYVELGREINLSLFTNTADVEAMRAHGIRSDYLQTGFDHNIFKKGTKQRHKDIVFMGNNYSHFPLSPLRYEMVHLLRTTYGRWFHLYGMSWDIQSENLMFNQQGECEAYQECKIAINLSHFDLPRYSSDRIQRIMGSGAFCLTKWYPEIEKDFTDGEHLVIWHDLPDLIRKIDYYLLYPEDMEKIAMAGYELAHSRDTWHHRINELKELICKAKKY